jgi:hypothetical protein
MKTTFVIAAAIASCLLSACGRNVKDYTYAEWKALDEEQQWEFYGKLDGQESLLLYGQTSPFSEEDTLNPKVTVKELIDRGWVLVEQEKVKWAKEKAKKGKASDDRSQ